MAGAMWMMTLLDAYEEIYKFELGIKTLWPKVCPHSSKGPLLSIMKISIQCLSSSPQFL